jgi:hypothetical protein
VTKVTVHEVMVPDHPREGADVGLVVRQAGSAHELADCEGYDPWCDHKYEITLTGQARSTLRAEFDDCKIRTGPGTTTLRAELPDQRPFCGLVQRIADLGLEVVDMYVVAPLGYD